MQRLAYVIGFLFVTGSFVASTSVSAQADPASCLPPMFWDPVTMVCLPSAPVPTTPTCMPPMVLSGGVCIMPVVCTPPQVLDPVTNVCTTLPGAPATTSIAPAPTMTSSAPMVCPPGTFWNGAMCMPGVAPTSGAPMLSSSAPMACPPGTFWNGAMCMPGVSPSFGSSAPIMPSGPMPGTTFPTCPMGQYWDFVQLKCMAPVMPSGNFPSMPSIASCGPNQYYDPMRQACVSGMPAALPGCTPDGYCPPPPQFSCAPNDPFCRPPPPPDCAQKIEALRGDMEALFKALSDRMQGFNQQFETERRSFGQGQHSPEEWRAWGEEWRKKGEAIGKEFAQQMNAFAESKGLGACAQYMPPPPMMGGMAMGGPDMGPRQYEQMNAPPVDNQFFNEDEEVRKIRMECEAQARELLGGNFGPPTGPPTGSPGQMPTSMPSPDVMNRVHEIMRECEKRIRGHFETVYEEQNLEEDIGQRFGSFSMYFDEDAGEIHVTGKYLSLVGNPESQVLSEITCGGQKFVDQLYGNGFLENFDFEQTAEGTALSIKAAGVPILRIHDNPRCAMNLATGGTVTELTLDLADYLDTSEVDGGVSFSDGETDGKVLLHEGELELQEGNVVVLHSKATFLVSNSAAAQASGSDLSNNLNYKEALEGGHIGGEIIIGGDGNQSTPYGDLTFDVETEGEGLTVIVDNANDEGKTIVMSVEEEILNIEQLNQVEIDVFDQLEAGDELMCTQEAEDLQDVLVPTDDGNCAEFWVVLDKNGAQVLVSIPHFSTKRIEVQSAASEDQGFLGIPSVGILGASLAAVAALVLVGVGLRRKP